MPTLTTAVPVLAVSASGSAEAFYEALGFALASAYRPFGGEDPAYLVLVRDGVALHVSSFSGDGTPGAGVANLIVDDVDAEHAAHIAAGVAGSTPPMDQTWGVREVHVADCDGNRVRFVEAESLG